VSYTEYQGTGASPDQRVYAASVYDAYKVYRTGEDEVRALDGVTVGFEAGRFTAVMGPSGSGKSTLMQCAAGLDTLTSGRTFIDNVETTFMNPTELTLMRREKLGFIFQAFNLIPALTAKENILLPLTLSGRDVDQAFFDYVVQTVGLGNRLTHKPSQLSGGQQQRVAVARALVSRPSIIFGDEPTGNLDSRSSHEVLGFMRTAVDQWNQTVVIVTHDPVAAAHTDAVIFMADGRIADYLERPTAETIFERMKTMGS
jgi:putative ABC transport system ATP-binding protein